MDKHIHELEKEITDLKEQLAQVSEQLKASKKESDLLDRVVALLPWHVYWLDRNNIIQGCNDQLAETLGLSSRQETVGKPVSDFINKENVEYALSVNNSVMETGIKYTAEEESFLSDGSAEYYFSTKAPLFNKDHKVIGLVGISVDITKRKRMEQELQQAKDAAEAANEAKSIFIRNMQHDIRTPLSGIWGLSDILERTIQDKFVAEYVGSIKSCSNKLLNFCDTILDFSNIEQGKFPLLEKPFSVRQLVENLQFLEEPAAQAKGLNLTMDYPHALPDILIGDEFRMYRILINLVSNAIKFTEKGSVELRVREIKKDLNKKEILLRFIVKDTGIGIPQDKQEIIFEMFSKLTPSNTGRYQGFGLGLKLVKEFVKDLGGTIKVESAPSKGAIFICTIPFRLPDERVQSLEKNHEG